MDRVTITQVRGAADAVSEMFEARGSTARVVVQRRNGYTALDLAYLSHHEPGALAIARMLTAGTTGEVWRYLQAMREAMYALEDTYR